MDKLLTKAQFFAEVSRCEYCEEKPCKKACPANCSPADFIMAVKQGEKADYKRAASEILSKNPLGGVCGAVCFSKHCMSGCVHKNFDRAINIPAIQLKIIQAAKELDSLPEFNEPQPNGKKIAIIGAGPAGLAAATVLSQEGFVVKVFEKATLPGGACWQIPDKRLDKAILRSDIEFIRSFGNIDFEFNIEITNPDKLLTSFLAVIVCTGKDSLKQRVTGERIFYAGDLVNGHTSVVEAVASGKNAAGKIVKTSLELIEKDTFSNIELSGKIETPVSLRTEFFGQEIISPFILSAAPHTDGYEQVKKAYQAGWAGAIMKTSFDNVPIRIPSEYMFVFDSDTYANCDNVSDHPLDRVCEEVKQLVAEFPDRLTMASTGGPVTGDDEFDKKGWQANTLKLERAGARGVEYSLSCPQGGDGAEGDIVSQNAKLTAKIIDWIMEVSNPDVPKLFKLTSAVTSIIPIVKAVKEVLEKHPNKKAGITLANSFPTLGFRKCDEKIWDEGVVVGMSGHGVAPISFLTLAKATSLGVEISGNGGPMDYKAAAHFLALGVKTVQFCNLVMKYGVNIIGELNSGLSYLLQEKGFKSVKGLIGCALPEPITDFMELSAVKKVSTVVPELCKHCGNCARCPYLAITLDENKTPKINSEKCVGCSICVKKCFAGALYMGDRE